MDISEIRVLAVASVNSIRSEFINDLPIDLRDSDNLLELLDSMDLVNLIMETESAFSDRLGKNISLANEYTFDSSQSPFNSFAKWLDHIAISIGV